MSQRPLGTISFIAFCNRTKESSLDVFSFSPFSFYVLLRTSRTLTRNKNTFIWLYLSARLFRSWITSESFEFNSWFYLKSLLYSWTYRLTASWMEEQTGRLGSSWSSWSRLMSCGVMMLRGIMGWLGWFWCEVLSSFRIIKFLMRLCSM